MEICNLSLVRMELKPCAAPNFKDNDTGWHSVVVCGIRRGMGMTRVLPLSPNDDPAYAARHATQP